MNTKKCKWCFREFPTEQFSLNFRMSGGRLNKCKACESETNRQAYIKRSAEIRANVVEYQRANRELIRARRHRYYLANIQMLAAKGAEYRNRPEQIEYNKRKCRERYRKNKADCLAKSKIYRSTERGKAVLKKSRNRDKIINAHKIKARYFVSNAIRDGRLKRPESCSDCGCSCRPQAHHRAGYDREQWLNVLWLCKDCHKKADLIDRTRPYKNNVDTVARTQGQARRAGVSGSLRVVPDDG